LLQKQIFIDRIEDVMATAWDNRVALQGHFSDGRLISVATV